MRTHFISYSVVLSLLLATAGCGKKDRPPAPVPGPPTGLVLVSAKLDNTAALAVSSNYNIKPGVIFRLSFNNAVDRATVGASVSIKENGSSIVPVDLAYENGDSTVAIRPLAPLKYLTRYVAATGNSVKTVKGGALVLASFMRPAVADVPPCLYCRRSNCGR